MRFRKKPILIEATQWHKQGDHPAVQTMPPRWWMQAGKRCVSCAYLADEHGGIDTLEGPHIVCPGDWIATGVKGENYPIKPDIFEATYEAVDDPGASD